MTGFWGNGTPWTSTEFYVLDSYAPGAKSAFGFPKTHGPIPGGCVGPGSQGRSGQSILTSTNYGRDSLVLPGKVEIRARSVQTEPNQPVIQAYSFVGNPAGSAIPGVTCAKLYLNLTPITVYSPQFARGSSAWAERTFLLDFTPQMTNLPLWMQSAWTDVSTGGLLLTDAVENFIPPRPLERLRALNFTTNFNATTGTLSDGSKAAPVLRYTY